MQITFPGPDGQLLTVEDPRRPPLATKPAKDVKIALPRERRPASWMLATFRV
jgi:hypothetical protein